MGTVSLAFLLAITSTAAIGRGRKHKYLVVGASAVPSRAYLWRKESTLLDHVATIRRGKCRPHLSIAGSRSRPIPVECTDHGLARRRVLTDLSAIPARESTMTSAPSVSRW